jgi:hypothetical protein
MIIYFHMIQILFEFIRILFEPLKVPHEIISESINFLLFYHTLFRLNFHIHFSII